MLQSVRRLTTATALVLAAIMLAAPAAQANGAKWDDPVDDTWTWDGDLNAVQVPDHPEADLVKAVVKHGARKIAVTATWDNLQKVGKGGGLMVQFLTNTDLLRNGIVDMPRRNWKGKSFVTEDRGPKVNCGVTHKVDYARDTVRLTVPSRCLKRPKWVRVIVRSTWVVGNEFYDDNPHNAGPDSGWSRKIRRG